MSVQPSVTRRDAIEAVPAGRVADGGQRYGVSGELNRHACEHRAGLIDDAAGHVGRFLRGRKACTTEDQDNNRSRSTNGYCHGRLCAMIPMAAIQLPITR